MQAASRVQFRRIVRLTITLLVIAGIANDVIKVVPAFVTSSDAVNAGMTAALVEAGAAPSVPDSGRQAAIDAATALGAGVESYEQQLGETASSRVVQVTIITSAPVQGTVIAAPILGLINGTPSSEWYAASGAKLIVSETKRVNVY
ncbi:MAG: hypothetical protein ACYDHQ_05215 [Coriobacteriia bacterium]